MPTWLLFLIPATVWSTTFYAITLQFGPVSPTVSLFYRFALAAAAMVTWQKARGASLSMRRNAHLLAFAMGLVQYTISYSITYRAEVIAPSGLVSVVFTLLVFMNPLGAKMFFGVPFARRTAFGAALGVLGVLSLFYSELSEVGRPGVAKGLFWVLGSTLAAWGGSMLTMKLGRMNVPVSTYTAWSLIYGASAFLLMAIVSKETWVWDSRPQYVASLLYLALGGTLVTFVCYNLALERMGPMVSYVSVVTPVGAILISTFLEGLVLHKRTFAAVLLCLVGAWFALPRARPKATRQVQAAPT